MTEPTTIAQVREFRRATRSIIRSDLADKDKLLALVRLVDRARELDESGWSQRAIWEEGRAFIRQEDDPADVPTSDPVEAACRKLLAQHLVRCPSCLRPLPTATELDGWRRLREQMIVDAERREEAGR